MSNISQSGSYRGHVVDRGLSKSSGGFLQLELSLQATEKYDEENQVWVPFNYEDSEAQAYLNLITSKDKENAISCRQVMKALNWDGMSFSTLNDPDSGLAEQIQWRMGEETYNEVTRVKVQNIDAYDAQPGRKVTRLDAADVRALDARYAAVLKNLGGGPKPKTARPAAPAPAPTPTPAAPAAGPDSTPAATASAAVAPPSPTPDTSTARSGATKKHGRPATPKALPAATMPAPTAAPMAEPMSKVDAWGKYTTAVEAAGKTDMEVQNAWVEVVREVGGDAAVENWGEVAEKAAAQLLG